MDAAKRWNHKKAVEAQPTANRSGFYVGAMYGQPGIMAGLNAIDVSVYDVWCFIVNGQEINMAPPPDCYPYETPPSPLRAELDSALKSALIDKQDLELMNVSSIGKLEDVIDTLRLMIQLDDQGLLS